MKNIEIENYLSSEYFKSRKQLVKETGVTDRAVRNKISQLKKEKPVIYNSQTKGYKLAKEIEEIETIEEAKEEISAIRHCINDIEARKRDMSESEMVYIAYIKRLEHRMMILENMNHIPRID